MDQQEVNAVRWQRYHERLKQRKLADHPDCRDPEHPGCESCGGGDDELGELSTLSDWSTGAIAAAPDHGGNVRKRIPCNANVAL